MSASRPGKWALISRPTRLVAKPFQSQAANITPTDCPIQISWASLAVMVPVFINMIETIARVKDSND
jgi:hypothetical protein